MGGDCRGNCVFRVWGITFRNAKVTPICGGWRLGSMSALGLWPGIGGQLLCLLVYSVVQMPFIGYFRSSANKHKLLIQVTFELWGIALLLLFGGRY